MPLGTAGLHGAELLEERRGEQQTGPKTDAIEKVPPVQHDGVYKESIKHVHCRTPALSPTMIVIS